MSRLLRSFTAEVASKRIPSSTEIVEHFETYIRHVERVGPGDLAALATKLAKTSDADIRSLVADIFKQRIPAPQMLQKIGIVALQRLDEFNGNEITELLHALSRQPDTFFRQGLQQNSFLVNSKMCTFSARHLALVANAYVRLQLQDRSVFLGLARRGVDVVGEGDAQAVASLAFGFAKMKRYHHGLFRAVLGRILALSDDLQSADVAQCLFAFSRSLPPPKKADPLLFAFDAAKGFGTLFNMLLKKMNVFAREDAGLTHRTALLALGALSRLQYRDESLLANLLSKLCWQNLNNEEFCIALHAVARLDGFVKLETVFMRAQQFETRNAKVCMIVSSLAVLQYSDAASRKYFHWCWNRRSMRSWTTLLARAASAALGFEQADEDGGIEMGTLATPRVAMGCGALLEPRFDVLFQSAKLEDLRQILEFARFASLHKSLRSRIDQLTVSELQVSVEMALKLLLLRDCASYDLQGEVHAAPYWIDIVASQRSG